MEHQIQFRTIKFSDYKALAKIIRDTWHYEKFCAPKTAKRMAMLYLASCLAEQTYTCVAVNNGEPVGVIMGKDERRHHTQLRYALLQAGATALLLCSKEGAKVAKLFAGFDTVDKTLLAQSGVKFEGQLAFFAVREDQRGSGIGTQLFKHFREDIKARGIKDFYLYTDSMCNFGFYEHQGLVRIGQTVFRMQSERAHEHEIEMFLYAFYESTAALPSSSPCLLRT